MNLPIRRPLARLPEPRQYPLTMLAVGAVRLPSPGEPENEGTGEPREREIEKGQSERMGHLSITAGERRERRHG